jgi:L-histidine N-alpha-methyltransferase
MKSFLISMKDQAVYIEAFDRTIPFYRWEPIHTEVSQKYDLPMIERLMAQSGLQITEIFYDIQAYFCDVLVRVR